MTEKRVHPWEVQEGTVVLTPEAVSTLSDTENAAMGCFLGAAVGDTAGAALEFKLSEDITPEQLADALLLKGGGPHQVAPGQITDDTELAIALAAALSTSEGWDHKTVLSNYQQWMMSRPFDIGGTCQRAFTTENASPNAASMSNGALMRAAPLAIVGHRMTVDDLAALASNDARISHPNIVCADASSIWVIACGHLILNANVPTRARDAVAAATAWANKHACEEVQSRVREAFDPSVPLVPFHPKIGWVRIAFSHALRHLVLESPFQVALRDTLAGGGDTDTNASIVCGLIGALWGLKASENSIPTRAWQAVVTCDTRTAEGVRCRGRMASYSGARIPGLCRRLCSIARKEKE